LRFRKKLYVVQFKVEANNGQEEHKDEDGVMISTLGWMKIMVRRNLIMTLNSWIDHLRVGGRAIRMLCPRIPTQLYLLEVVKKLQIGLVCFNLRGRER
jgi:hypothetical protein